jgi:hypothetical protein
MKRRQFIALLGSAAAAWPVAARAQQAKGPTRIGLLPFGSPPNAYDKSLVDAFRSGLRQAGLIEDHDIVVDIVWTSGSDADTDKAVAELIRRGAELLVPTGSTASVAAKRPSAWAIPSPWGWSKTLRTRAATPLVSVISFLT